MSGLTSLFPHSKRYAQYYMGHLSYDETNEVDILAGAYMMMRKECLDKVGLLDEDFFMYGEDIDLSYRITQGGYKITKAKVPKKPVLTMFTLSTMLWQSLQANIWTANKRNCIH